MKLLLFVVFSCIIYCVTAQDVVLLNYRDTIKYNYFLANNFDSVDIYFTPHSSTYPSGGFNKSENIFSNHFLFQNVGGALHRNFSEWSPKRFSALPHLGFSYSFGSQSNQNVNVEYTQSFDTKNSLNINYDLRKGNAFLRSSDFVNSDVKFQFDHRSSFYSFVVKGQFINRKIGQNGGIVSDSLIDVSGLSFISVAKTNADSKYKGGRLAVEHYFDFLSKDSTKVFGVLLENQFQGLNRKYTEISNGLSMIYSNVYINSDSTFDQYQLSELNNLVGLYFSDTRSYYKVGIQNNWWNYFNLGNKIARNEYNLNGEIELMFNQFQILNHSNFNLIGAKGEWFSKTKLNYRYEKFDFQSNLDVSSLLPEVFQRFYFGNNLYYHTQFNDLKKQTRLLIDGKVNYSVKNHVFSLFASNLVLKNNYWFYNDNWRNDTLLSIHNFSLGASIHSSIRFLHFTLKGTYNTGNWMPNYFVQSRVYLKGKILKGRKLLGQLGVEPSYHSGFYLFDFVPVMDVVQFTNISNDAMMNFHVFGAFEVEKFRFFFRAENVAYLWNDSKNRVAVGYPIPGLQLRLGITWDFFN